MKKLRNKKGFTLTEMLISVLLLGIVSLMVTAMMSAILSSTVTMREVAQAEILGSEALDNLQGQLRVARNVTINSDNVTFDLDDSNKGYTLAIADGKIVMEHEKDGETETELLFAGTSYGNLRVSDLHFVRDDAKNAIEIFVAVSFGDKTLWSGSVTVKPLNGILNGISPN